MFKPARSLALDAPQRKRLEFLVRAGNTSQKLVQRARIILLAAAGRPNAAIAREVGVSRPTVLLWRERFARGGVPGLSFEKPRPGRKPAIGPDKIKAVVEATLQTTRSEERRVGKECRYRWSPYDEKQKHTNKN